MIISNLIIKITRKLLTYKCLQNGLKYIITELYRGIALGDLTVKSEVVRVKKGKARYRLVFLSTDRLRLRLNIGRHYNPYTASFDSFTPTDPKIRA
jgi:hypothetical protein